MANSYITDQEVKDALPDGIRAATTKYDSLIRQLCNRPPLQDALLSEP